MALSAAAAGFQTTESITADEFRLLPTAEVEEPDWKDAMANAGLDIACCEATRNGLWANKATVPARRVAKAAAGINWKPNPQP
jgi:hypothetical protein